MSVSSFSMWNLLSGLLPKLVAEIPADAHDDDLSVEMRSLNKSTTRFGGVASPPLSRYSPNRFTVCISALTSSVPGLEV
jgi:hypothetical protein